MKTVNKSEQSESLKVIAISSALSVVGSAVLLAVVQIVA